MQRVGNKNISYIPIQFSEKYANYFDVIKNGDIGNRKSDVGYIEKNQPMLGPRMGSQRVGDTLINDWVAGSYTTGKYVVLNSKIYRANTNTSNQPPHADWIELTGVLQSDIVFYTDKDGNRRLYRVFDQNFMYLNAGVWTTIMAVGTNKCQFSQQKCPVNLDGSTSTSRTTAGVASGAEKVKKDGSDPLNANNNVGKIVLITSGLYKGCFGPIVSYDSGTSEYTLGGAGITTALPGSVTYQVYETLGECLQMTRGEANLDDLYFYGIEPLEYMTGFATSSLKTISAITSTQSANSMEIFNNTAWTFAGSTLFYSGGFPGNPLFYNYTGAFTPGVLGKIIDIFPFKNRLVTVSTNSIFTVKSDLSVDRNISAYGGFIGGYINTGDDVYMLTTNKALVSLSESISGVVDLKNVGETVDNYIINFEENIAFGYDGRRVYFYGEKKDSGTGDMCVYDSKRKMWIIYTGLSPKSIAVDGGEVYMNDLRSDIVRKFTFDVTTDVAIGTNKTSEIAMELITKQIDNDDIFTMKTIANVFIALEDESQILQIDTYLANVSGVYKKDMKEVILVGESGEEITIGEGVIGENTFGVGGPTSPIAKPVIAKVMYSPDKGNFIKIYIAGKGGTPFYINRIDVGIAMDDPKSFINPLSVT